MNAVVWTAYGGPEVLQPAEIPMPVPREREILLRVMATTVTAGDCEMRALRLPMSLGLPMRLYAGFRRPRRIRILGQEVAGVVEAVGSGVTEFRPGDAVFGAPGMRLGGYAEYACLSVAKGDAVLAHIPEGVAFEDAVPLTVGGLEALHFLRRADLSEGQSLLVNGAGGSIGTYAVQLGRHFGLTVTAVDHGMKRDLLRALGADRVIDYTREDFSRSGRRYDAVLDMVGPAAFRRCMRALAPGGKLLMANPSIGTMLRGKGMSLFNSRRVIGGAGRQDSEDLRVLAALLAEGKLRTVIDRRYPLAEIADAHRHAESGRKIGNIIISP